MIKPRHFFLIACFALMLPVALFAEAPVVDESENFALLDGQQAANERPFVHDDLSASDKDEETALANDHLDTSEELESHSSNSHNSNAMLLDKVQGLQQEIQELRGQIEVQAHDLKLLQQQQLAFYKDLDARLRHDTSELNKQNNNLVMPTTPSKPITKPIETPKSPAAVPPPVIQPISSNTSSRTNPADEQVSYLAAYELIKNKQFDEALPAMQAFVTQYPKGGYTANAQYWLGELYMVKHDYPNAMAHFEVVLQAFPSSSKSAASLLKMGYALAASGRKQDAVQRLQQVVKNYPDTNTAQLAKAKLELLNS